MSKAITVVCCQTWADMQTEKRWERRLSHRNVSRVKVFCLKWKILIQISLQHFFLYIHRHTFVLLYWTCVWINILKGQQVFAHMDGQTGGERPVPPQPALCRTHTQTHTGFHLLPWGYAMSFSTTISQDLSTLTQNKPHPTFLKPWTQFCRRAWRHIFFIDVAD